MLTLWDKRTPVLTLPALAPTLAPPVALRRLRSASVPAAVRANAWVGRALTSLVRQSPAALPLPSVRKAPSLLAPALAARATSAMPDGLPALASLRRSASIERIRAAMVHARPSGTEVEPARAAHREQWEPVAVAMTHSQPVAPEGVPWLREASSREAEASPTDAMDLTPLLAEALRQLGRE